jgi:flagellar hook-basal body complex protein FliE
MNIPITNGPVRLPDLGSLPNLTGGAGKKEGNFASTLASAVEQVDDLHTSAQSEVANTLQNGGQDLHNVMIAVEKADVAFQLMMQVRNKIVNAYQEISRLQF